MLIAEHALIQLLAKGSDGPQPFYTIHIQTRVTRVPFSGGDLDLNVAGIPGDTP
jgi:hypothetical protein